MNSLILLLFFALTVFSTTAQEIDLNFKKPPIDLIDLRADAQHRASDFEVTLEKRIDNTSVYGDLYLAFETHDSECGVVSFDDLYMLKMHSHERDFFIVSSINVYRKHKDLLDCNSPYSNKVQVKLISYSGKKLSAAIILAKVNKLKVNGEVPRLVGFD